MTELAQVKNKKHILHRGVSIGLAYFANSVGGRGEMAFLRDKRASGAGSVGK
jgi:hypothetical protein